MKNVEKQIENLHRELEKKRGEKEKVVQVVNNLMINQQDRMIQMERLNAQIQQDDAELKENKKTMDTTNLFNTDEKQIHQQVRDNLLKRRGEHEFFLNNTKTLLQTTENLVTSVMERKEEVEKLMKQMDQDLHEAERQREKIQKKLQSAGERRNKVMN